MMERQVSILKLNKELVVILNKEDRMPKRRTIVASKLKILLVAMLFLSGCATAVNVPKTQPKKGVLDDVLVFKDLQKVDLDNDGQKEMVAIYTTNKSNNLVGVKVVKFQKDRGEIIFERIYNASKIEFTIKDNIPTIIVEHAVQSSGCASGKIRSYYQWNGTAFAPTLK